MKYLICLLGFLSVLKVGEAQLLPFKEKTGWGILNPNGEIVVQAVYDSAATFGTFAMLTQRKKSEDAPEKVVIVNMTGQKTFETDSRWIAHVGYGPHYTAFWRVFKDGLQGMIDSTGKVVFSPQFKHISHMDANGYAIFNQDGRYGVLHKSGQLILQSQFKTEEEAYRALIGKSFDFDVSVFDRITLTNKPLIPVYSGRLNKYGTTQQDKWGFADRGGNVVVKQRYTSVYEFNKGYAVVRIKDKHGLIDTAGNYILKPQYAQIMVVSENRIWANSMRNGQTLESFLFDGRGNLVRKYEGHLQWMSSDQKINARYVALSKDGNGAFYGSSGMGIVDITTGNIILQPDYTYLVYTGDGKVKIAKQFEWPDEALPLFTVEEMGYVAAVNKCDFGLFDLETNSVILEPRFANIGWFNSNGTAYALDSLGYIYLLQNDMSMHKVDKLLTINGRSSAIVFKWLFGSQTPEDFIMIEHRILHADKMSRTLQRKNGDERDVKLERMYGDIYRLTLEPGIWGYLNLNTFEVVWWSTEEVHQAVKELQNVWN